MNICFSLRLENKRFAALDATKETNRNGRVCAKCGKYREWHFTANQTTWEW